MRRCLSAFRFDRPAGWYDLNVQYFDQNDGQSKFRIFIGEKQVDEWIADDNLPATKPGGDSSTRRRVTGLALRPGDEIRIEGIPDGSEQAALDCIEIQAHYRLTVVFSDRANSRPCLAIQQRGGEANLPPQEAK